jgi:hypothetical protein
MPVAHVLAPFEAVVAATAIAVEKLIGIGKKNTPAAGPELLAGIPKLISGSVVPKVGAVVLNIWI